MLFGVRVSGGIVGSHTYTFDYCAGADESFQQQLFLIMFSILSNLPEEITDRELQQMLPTYRVRPKLGSLLSAGHPPSATPLLGALFASGNPTGAHPLDRDPCWDKLQQLAGRLAIEVKRGGAKC